MTDPEISGVADHPFWTRLNEILLVCQPFGNNLFPSSGQPMHINNSISMFYEIPNLHLFTLKIKFDVTNYI